MLKDKIKKNPIKKNLKKNQFELNFQIYNPSYKNKVISWKIKWCKL
jgi:hypothetical protein